jgi:hypothetical protein
VEPVKDWRSDCLAKRNLVGIELCGVLGRLHSIEGLTQSNNNAKLNYSAKRDQMLLEMSAKAEDSREGKKKKKGVALSGRKKITRPTEPYCCPSHGWTIPFFLFYCCLPLFLAILFFFLF